jgi:hypothetical protein
MTATFSCHWETVVVRFAQSFGAARLDGSGCGSYGGYVDARFGWEVGPSDEAPRVGCWLFKASRRGAALRAQA